MHTESAFDDADLNGFVDGRIEPSRASALAASLATDPEAAARLEAWRRQNDSLRTMFSSVLAEPVPVRLMPVAVPPMQAAVRREAERPDGRIAGVLATTAIGAALIGFALGALAGVGTDGFGLTPGARRAAAASLSASFEARDLASRAAEAHRTFLADPSRPFELAAGEPKPARGAGRRLGSGLRIPDLSRQGWTFLGARTVPGRHGPGAFLAYGDGADRLGLTVSRGIDAGEGRLIMADDEEPPLGVAAWADGAFGYALTSDRGLDWLGRNLAPLRDSVRAQTHGDDEAPERP